MLSRLKSWMSDPLQASYRAAWRLRPSLLRGRYRRLASGAGLDRLYLVLSFDCDTDDDIEAALSVHRKLLPMGVHAVYAVPGELLERGSKAFREIARSGSEFLNHGYKQHTEQRADGRWESCFFYDQLPRERVRADIEQGHECVARVIGTPPSGFRTPHFGTFSTADELRFMYGVLKGLGYRFSTSTTPIQAYRFGPIHDAGGILEIPLSGLGSDPFTLLDTWGCFAAEARQLSEQDYLREAELALDEYRQRRCGLLNYYADPSHIADEPLFFEAVAKWAAAARPVGYSELLEITS